MKNPLSPSILLLSASTGLLLLTSCHTARPVASDQSQSHESATASGKNTVPAAPHTASHMKRRYGR